MLSNTFGDTFSDIQISRCCKIGFGEYKNEIFFKSFQLVILIHENCKDTIFVKFRILSCIVRNFLHIFAYLSDFLNRLILLLCFLVSYEIPVLANKYQNPFSSSQKSRDSHVTISRGNVTWRHTLINSYY